MIVDAVPAPAQETLNSTGAQRLTNAARLDKGKTCLGRLRWVSLQLHQVDEFWKDDGNKTSPRKRALNKCSISAFQRGSKAPAENVRGLCGTSRIPRLDPTPR
jgi:hypothetical protein